VELFSYCARCNRRSFGLYRNRVSLGRAWKKVIPHQRTNELPQAANRVVGGVGRGGGVAVRVVGEKLFAGGSIARSDSTENFTCCGVQSRRLLRHLLHSRASAKRLEDGFL